MEETEKSKPQNKKTKVQKRNFKNLNWEHTTYEDYDLVRHFIEINNCFPKNTTYHSNVDMGFFSHDILDFLLKDMKGEIVYKSDSYNYNIRKMIYLVDKSFIILDRFIFKSTSELLDVPEQLSETKFLSMVSTITVLHSEEFVPDEINEIIFGSIFETKTTQTIGIISRDQDGFYINDIVMDTEKCNELDLHYGDGFTIFHEKLLKRLKEKNKGITLLHGIPGSGKSYYINRLIYDLNENSNKKVILVPTNMVSYLLEPDFNTFLLGLTDQFNYNKEDDLNSDDTLKTGLIFIIEDAEPILLKREEGFSSQSTSNILNLTDGLLNSIFKIQIVATYNTNDENIDPAVKRDKRLIADKNFTELCVSDAKNLSKYLGIDENEVKYDLTVAQIYSLLDKEDDEILIESKSKNKKDKGKAGLKLI